MNLLKKIGELFDKNYLLGIIIFFSFCSNYNGKIINEFKVDVDSNGMMDVLRCIENKKNHPDLPYGFYLSINGENYSGNQREIFRLNKKPTYVFFKDINKDKNIDITYVLNYEKSNKVYSLLGDGIGNFSKPILHQ